MPAWRQAPCGLTVWRRKMKRIAILLLLILGFNCEAHVMEDVELSLMFRNNPSVRIGTCLTVSARRWEKQSFISYIFPATEFS
jgi:hypothetical protein